MVDGLENANVETTSVLGCEGHLEVRKDVGESLHAYTEGARVARGVLGRRAGIV